MVDPAEREGQVMAYPADLAPNPTKRRKTLLIGTTMEEVAKDKTNGGRR
jgi:hypothetical protein